jgi:hypothetical protein
MSVGSGVAFLISDGNTIRDLPDAFAFIGTGKFCISPPRSGSWGAVTAVVYLLLQKTPFGSYCYAIGGNKSVAFLSGVQTRKNQDDHVYAERLFSRHGVGHRKLPMYFGQPTLGVDMPLQAIAAAVIGGASMSGGGVPSAAPSSAFCLSRFVQRHEFFASIRVCAGFSHWDDHHRFRLDRRVQAQKGGIKQYAIFKGGVTMENKTKYPVELTAIREMVQKRLTELNNPGRIPSWTHVKGARKPATWRGIWPPTGLWALT